MLTPSQRGAVAESAVIHGALKLGLDVYRPVAEGGRYDLVIDAGSQLLRVQCKTAVRRKSVVVIECRSCRRTADGYLRRTYAARDVDAIAAHCAEIDRLFLLPPPVFDGRTAIQLRLAASRNNQKLGIRWADDFDFAARLSRLKGP